MDGLLSFIFAHQDRFTFCAQKAEPENGGATIRKISHGICFPLPIDLNECGIETVSSGNNSFNGSLIV